MNWIEFKVLIYIAVVIVVLHVIAKINYKKSSLNWKAYCNHTDLGALLLLLKYGFLIYLIGRFIIYPITYWWFN